MVVYPSQLKSKKCQTPDITLKCPPSLPPWTWVQVDPYLRCVRVSFSFGMTIFVAHPPLLKRGRVHTVEGKGEFLCRHKEQDKTPPLSPHL